MDFADFYKAAKGTVGQRDFCVRVEVERKGVYEHLAWSARVGDKWTRSYFKPENALDELQKLVPVRQDISRVGDPNKAALDTP